MSAVPPSVTRPNRIGRFEIVDVLGRGTQGMVYLARDPELEREVAIKTLRGHVSERGVLLAEARRVARLQHPAIVSLFEAGMAGEEPFLVFERVRGETLKGHLAAHGTLPPARAMAIARSLLDGLAHAHERGVLHRDIAPGNVFLSPENEPRIIDFGVAAMLDGGTVKAEVIGTVCYLAPEALEGGDVDGRADLYSVAALTYEMLTGRRLHDGADAMAVLYQVAEGNMRPPSAVNPKVPSTLDELLLRGLTRRPQERYDSAAAFRDAIDQWFERHDAAHAGPSSDTIAFLLRRMRRNPDFPAVSRHIAEINRRTSRDHDADATELANILLEDFALTTKVLKAVNAACFSQYGGNISTVSRAVVILGFEQVRLLALSILLFDHLKNARQADKLKEAACHGLMSALTAQTLAGTVAHVREEEVFIGAMLHTIGRCIVIYYFPDEFDDIQDEMRDNGVSESSAARRVLGATLHELGAAVAREWNLPWTLSRAIAPPPEKAPKASIDSDERNVQLAWLGNEVTAAAAGELPMDKAIGPVCDRYERALGVSRQQLGDALRQAADQLTTYADVIGLDLKGTETFRSIMAEPTLKAVPEEAELPGPTAAAPPFDVTTEQPMYAAETGPSEEGCKVMLECITELTSALLEEYNLNHLLSVYLEAVFRGMAFDRVVLALRDTRSNSMIGRLGLGAGVKELMPNFRFPVARNDDVLSMAVRGRESVVLDTGKAQGAVPAWCDELLAPGALFVSPFIVDRRCLALVYGDFARPSPQLTKEHLRLYRALTNQIRLAFVQKRS